jgi:hypothetical protein
VTTAKKKPLSARAKARLAKIRRDPFGRLSSEVGRYLETVGWRALIIGSPQIRGFETKPVSRNLEFVVTFSGGRIPPEGAPKRK